MPVPDMSKVELFHEYSQIELAEKWGYKSYDAIRRGIVTPSGTNIIILFVTKTKVSYATQYEDVLDNDILHMSGENGHGNDKRLTRNKDTSVDRIFLFYREIHHSGFIYYGQVFLTDYDLYVSEPSKFTFKVPSMSKEENIMKFFTLKISDPSATDFVRDVKNSSQNLVVDQLNQLKDDLDVGGFVFIQLGGDRVSWNKGLIGLAEITRSPFDEGYDADHPRNFKLGLKMDLVLNDVIRREDFIPYLNTFDAGGIGPSTKGEQNQAIKSITTEQASAILRAMVETKPELEVAVRNIFDESTCNSIFGQMPIMIKKYLPYPASVKFTHYTEQQMQISDVYNSKTTIEYIKQYICNKGFAYSNSLIENFYLSLKSKPFVILAGTSGTGKTRLAKLFAEAIGAEFKLIPVRPDWSDSSDLFGHLDISGNYIDGPVIEFISKAIKNPSKPHFLCLDEMNLARVEYYFSDFLSIIETRERKDGRVITDTIDLCEEAVKKYGSVYIPDNLYIIGTVNMDETTFPFSKKVLDRANTIEFSYVDLTPKFDDYDETASPIELQNSFMKTEFIKLSECAEYADYAGEICSVLKSINDILSKADAHIGYRVRDEICFYMINNKNAGLLSEDDAMDNQIMQKILPRIQGSSAAVKKMLCELFKKSAGDFSGYQTDSNVADEMKKAADKGKCKYKNSAAKIAGMIRRFEEDGFTSYWI